MTSLIKNKMYMKVPEEYKACDYMKICKSRLGLIGCFSSPVRFAHVYDSNTKVVHRPAANQYSQSKTIYQNVTERSSYYCFLDMPI